MKEIKLAAEKMGIPPAFRERCAVRITDASFGPNSKGNPMITVNCELLGYFDNNNNLLTKMDRGGTTYKLAGLTIRPEFFTLTDTALPFYGEFAQKVKGEPVTSIDETNPDIEYLKTGPVLQAIVSGQMDIYRKQLTDEEREEKKAKGEKPEGDPILDDEGKPLEMPKLRVNMWLKPYVGTLPDDIKPF